MCRGGMSLRVCILDVLICWIEAVAILQGLHWHCSRPEVHRLLHVSLVVHEVRGLMRGGVVVGVRSLVWGGSVHSSLKIAPSGI